MRETRVLRAWGVSENDAAEKIDLAAKVEIERMKKQEGVDLEMIYRNVVWDQDVKRFFAILLLK